MTDMSCRTPPSTVLTTLRLANGETMPTLDAYLAAAKRTKVHLVLELKPHATPEAETAAAEAAVKAVEAAKLTKARTYITFSRHAMEELIRLAPKNDVLYLGGDISPEELEKLRAAGGDYNHGVYLKAPRVAGVHEAARHDLERLDREPPRGHDLGDAPEDRLPDHGPSRPLPAAPGQVIRPENPFEAMRPPARRASLCPLKQ